MPSFHCKRPLSRNSQEHLERMGVRTPPRGRDEEGADDALPPRFPPTRLRGRRPYTLGSFAARRDTRLAAAHSPTPYGVTRRTPIASVDAPSGAARADRRQCPGLAPRAGRSAPLRGGAPAGRRPRGDGACRRTGRLEPPAPHPGDRGGLRGPGRDRRPLDRARLRRAGRHAPPRRPARPVAAVAGRPDVRAARRRIAHRARRAGARRRARSCATKPATATSSW